MTVLSKVLHALIAIALAWLGRKLGIEFTDADTRTINVWVTTLTLVVWYQVLWPWLRKRLVARGLLRGRRHRELEP